MSVYKSYSAEELAKEIGDKKKTSPSLTLCADFSKGKCPKGYELIDKSHARKLPLKAKA